MADRRKHRRRARSRRSRSRSRGDKFSSENLIKAGNKSTKNKDPFLYLALALAVSFFVFYLVRGEKDRVSPDASSLDQPVTKLTIEERIKKKNSKLKLEQDIHSQEIMSEKFQKPVEDVDPIEPELSPLDMGIRFSDSAPLKEVTKELSELPFENEGYEDPEDIIRRQLAHREWLEEHLKERNVREKKDFIRRFVKIAKEQGYNVHFTKDLQVILEPIDPNERVPEEDFEKVQIDWD